MRIYVHDFGGYGFITDLSRELASRGHTVRHAYNARLTSGQGVEPLPGDSERFVLAPIRISRHFDKYSLARRVPIELEYGGAVGRDLRAFGPDVVVSANTPLFSQWRIQSSSRSAGAGFVFWIQDLLGFGIRGELRRRLGPIGSGLGSVVEAIERRMIRRSDHVVAISDAFTPVVARSGLRQESLSVIPNWAALDATPVMERRNPWAEEQGLGSLPVLLYAGTLGRKHDPLLLEELAGELRGVAEVVVISEGPVADELKEGAARSGVPLRVLPFQPYDRLPEVLATADILLAILTPEAGRFSVPSKVLTYLCAGRPILASMPEDNLAARILLGEEAGVVVAPGDRGAFIAAAQELLADEASRARLAKNARRYAEEHFDLKEIGDRFEGLLATVVSG